MRNIRNMAEGMARYVQYAKLQRQFRKRNGIAFPQRMGNLWNRFLTRPKYGYIEMSQ